MTYKPIGKGEVRDWIWAAVVLGTFAVALLWFFWYLDPLEGQAPAQTAEQTVRSDEWTTAPEGEHIEVDLPETPMTNVPQNEPAEQSRDRDN